MSTPVWVVRPFRRKGSRLQPNKADIRCSLPTSCCSIPRASPGLWAVGRQCQAPRHHSLPLSQQARFTQRNTMFNGMPTRNLSVSFLGGQCPWSPPLKVLRILLGAAFEKQPRDLRVPFVGSLVQRRSGVHGYSTCFYQQLRNVFVPPLGG
ncbi:hypothetical protein GGTG_04190 [Gaeumannomyces tritici R3-111a-1]|uniref:Uncharacterized protein n=1 Tax=Gaeumannomyces tritici (strain R3-111a-1) TaxID=644352 RepID=J3NSE4_GAET3|nr:hypothetical protein GGTG_04190 [Gaeumannomyces tritici R3-111a-1]EJT79101.1 hypothetical protein GGTG_04190 [Gaeumannomyces tritici R3-111a-1]